MNVDGPPGKTLVYQLLKVQQESIYRNGSRVHTLVGTPFAPHPPGRLVLAERVPFLQLFCKVEKAEGGRLSPVACRIAAIPQDEDGPGFSLDTPSICWSGGPAGCGDGVACRPVVPTALATRVRRSSRELSEASWPPTPKVCSPLWVPASGEGRHTGTETPTAGSIA